MVMVSLGHAQAGPKICHSRLREPITAGSAARWEDI
jgi:hypothetical protein